MASLGLFLSKKFIVVAIPEGCLLVSILVPVGYSLFFLSELIFGRFDLLVVLDIDVLV